MDGETFHFYLPEDPDVGPPLPGQPVPYHGIWFPFGLEQADGAVWISVESLLVRFDLETELFTRFEASSGRNGNMLCDNPHLWVVGGPDGLYKLDAPTGDVLAQYTTADGLPTNELRDVEIGPDGHLWLSTYKRTGVIRFDPETGRVDTDAQIRMGTIGELIPSPDAETMYFNMFEQPAGFGHFQPGDINPDRTNPRALVTELQVFGETLRPDAEGNALASAIWNGPRVDLTHEQSTLAIEFGAVDLEQPGRSRFEYRLDGVDDDWIAADGGQRIARYPQLQPGTYTFRVRAADEFGEFDGDGTTLTIQIRPPWWRTWWAYSLVAAVIALA